MIQNVNKQRTRREYAKRGERSSRMWSFRIDFENWDALAGVANKGRLVNQLIEQWRRQQRTDNSHLDDEDAEPVSCDDYQP